MKIEFGKYYTYKYPTDKINYISYFILDHYSGDVGALILDVLMLDYNCNKKMYLYNAPARHRITLDLINYLITDNRLKIVKDKKTITKLQLLGLFPIWPQDK